jgi:heme/copper-type cytochrome/quinol oxidase subunit 3
MSDIQIRLADINRRAADAQAKRDRQFFTIIGFHLLVIVGALFLFVSIPLAQQESHKQILETQEQIAHAR